jgi:hypothetical protein
MELLSTSRAVSGTTPETPSRLRLRVGDPFPRRVAALHWASEKNPRDSSR